MLVITQTHLPAKNFKFYTCTFFYLYPRIFLFFVYACICIYNVVIHNRLFGAFSTG